MDRTVIQQSLFFKYFINVACHPNPWNAFVHHRQRFCVYELEALGTSAFTDAEQFQLGIIILVATQQPGQSFFASFHIQGTKVWKHFIVQGHFVTFVPSVFISGNCSAAALSADRFTLYVKVNFLSFQSYTIYRHYFTTSL